MIVKVCGMRDISNIKALIPLQVDWMGLIFYRKSKRFIGDEDPQKYKSLAITKVGVFVNSPKKELLEKVDQFGLDYVQLHGDESVFYCQEIQAAGVKVIKAFAIDEHFNFNNLRSFTFSCDYFLFDTKGKKRGGNGVVFEWRILERYKGKTPFFLSGGIKPELAGKIKKLDYPMLAALDLNSGFEIEPGYKNVQVISDFINDLNTERVGDWGGSR